jgi:putative addiction module component (TIGR02574 family)
MAWRWFGGGGIAGTVGEVGKRLLKEALELPDAERAELAAELMASFDGPADPDVEAAWALEIERRATNVLTGESQGNAWDEVRGRIEHKLRGR